MATAIFIGSLFIAGAINPDWAMPTTDEETKFAGWLLLGFIAYDLTSLALRSIRRDH